MFDSGWEVMLATIEQLHQETENDGTELIVALISPADVVAYSQMSTDELEAVHQKIPDLQRAQFNLPHAKLTTSLSEKGIAVLDLQSMFIQHFKDTQEQLYFPRDKHWNVRGNQFVAEILRDKICQQYPDFGC